MPHRLFNKSNNGTCRLTVTVLCSMIGVLLVCYLIAFGHVINGGKFLTMLVLYVRSLTRTCSRAFVFIRGFTKSITRTLS
jgi:hypothetical protein